MWPMQEMQFFLVGFIFLELAPYLHMEHFWLEKKKAATLGKCTWASLLSLFGELKFWQRYPRLHSGDMFKVIQCTLSIPPSRAGKVLQLIHTFFMDIISYLISHTHTQEEFKTTGKKKYACRTKRDDLMYAFALFLLLWRIRGHTH